MNKKAVCFGECLIDCFPDKNIVGGAPLNISARLQSLGMKVSLISCVGNDNQADKILNFMNQNGLSQSFISYDNILPTGQVKVSINAKGSASYEIQQPVAWDNITLQNSMIEETKMADVFVFGTLALRKEKNRNSLFKLVESAKFVALDVNLRTPFYNLEIIEKSVEVADLVKMNDEELHEVCSFYNFQFSSIEKGIKFLAEKFPEKQICVTQGKQETYFFSKGSMYKIPSIKSKVVDTVGAGDSFLAGLIFQLLQGENIDYALAYGTTISSLVVEKYGANPKILQSEINQRMTKHFSAQT